MIYVIYFNAETGKINIRCLKKVAQEAERSERHTRKR